MPSSLRSGGLGASILNSATSSAARCGGGSEATRSAGTDESRSDSPANESFTSDSVDEVASTQTPLCLRPSDVLPPDGRLPDSRLTLDQQPGRIRPLRGQRRLDPGDLDLASDHG